MGNVNGRSISTGFMFWCLSDSRENRTYDRCYRGSGIAVARDSDELMFTVALYNNGLGNS